MKIDQASRKLLEVIRHASNGCEARLLLSLAGYDIEERKAMSGARMALYLSDACLYFRQKGDGLGCVTYDAIDRYLNTFG